MNVGIELANPVLVLTDGSVGADAAVDWAAAEANRRGRPLLIMMAAAPPSTSELQDSMAEFGGSSVLEHRLHKAEHREARAHELLRNEVGRVAAAFPDLGTETVVFAGSPQEALQAHSARAELIVIGSRDRGAVRSSMLGSLGLWVTRHLEGDWVIVHHNHGCVDVVSRCSA